MEDGFVFFAMYHPMNTDFGFHEGHFQEESDSDSHSDRGGGGGRGEDWSDDWDILQRVSSLSSLRWGKGCRSISVTCCFHRLSCLFVAGVSGHTFHFRVQLQCVAGCYMTLMVLPPFPHKKDPLLHLTILFAKGAWGRFLALDKLFFPSCELHVLPVVLTSRQPTPHVTAHVSPYRGGGGGGQQRKGWGGTGLRERGNDTSKSTGRSGRQKAATQRNMRREERVTVQGPVKEQQPDGMSHRGFESWWEAEAWRDTGDGHQEGGKDGGKGTGWGAGM